MLITKNKILVIDNDVEFSLSTADVLKSEGFQVILSSNSKEAIQIAKDKAPQLILIDLIMPEMDGVDICLELREFENLSSCIIAFYTERNDEYSQIAAFDAGADDYIIKPAKPRVLLSRIKALLKKRVITKPDPQEEKGLIIDRERYLILCDGKEITLPRKEFELLSLLKSSSPKIFTREQIAQAVWGKDMITHTRTIDVHIRKLREKLGDKYIKTIKGRGYGFEE